jgi:hypothetical protein
MIKGGESLNKNNSLIVTSSTLRSCSLQRLRYKPKKPSLYTNAEAITPHYLSLLRKRNIFLLYQCVLVFALQCLYRDPKPSVKSCFTVFCDSKVISAQLTDPLYQSTVVEMVRRIRKFLGLQDPDPSIIKQKSKNKKNIGFLLFFLLLYDFLSLKTSVNETYKSNKKNKKWHLDSY